MNDSVPTVLSIDIGSTRTHLAAIDVDRLQCVGRIDSDNTDFDAAFIANIKKIADTYPSIRRVNISSCVKGLAARAKDICINNVRINNIHASNNSINDDNIGTNDNEGGLFDTVELIHQHDGLPIAFKYENPNTLGSDRISNALACAALFKSNSCVIIDAGTAITVDYLRNGKIFEGGAILPGCAMQFWALHTRTDALPLIDIGSLIGINTISGINDEEVIESEISPPSTSTAGCIRAGVFYGAAGAVDRCIDECLQVNGGGNVSIVATGGGWESIRPLIKHEAVTIPDLTLIGAGVYK